MPGLPSIAEVQPRHGQQRAHRALGNLQSVSLTGNGTSKYFAANVWYLNGEDSLGLSYEKEIRTNGTTEHKHYIQAAGLTFAEFVSRTGSLNGLLSAYLRIDGPSITMPLARTFKYSSRSRRSASPGAGNTACTPE